MADDSQFDPLGGIITPQTLAMLRMQQQQKAFADANAPGVSGLDSAAKSAGLAFGTALGSGGGGQGNFLDQLAAQNQGILSAPTGSDAADPYEARAQGFEQKAKLFAQAGQYATAQQFVNAAQIVRKQGLDAQKTQAETYEAGGKGAEALSKLWSTPQEGTNPDTGKLQYFQTGPGGAVRWLDSQGKPQVPAATVTVNQEKPFLGEFAKKLDTYSQQADTAANSLALIQDARTKLNAGIYTGTAADTRQKLGTFLSSVGFKGSDDPTANTAAFIADTKQLALEARPVGMRMTNYEMQQLQSMTGADHTITDQGLKLIFDVRQRAAEALINNYNSVSDTLRRTAASSKDDNTRNALNMASQLYPRREIPNSAAAAAPPANAPTEGATSTSKSGKPIVFKAGHWQYVQ